MKITTFNPSILTNDAAPILQLFEDLGFVQTHNKVENVDVEFSAHRMKDANGFHVESVLYVDTANMPILFLQTAS